MFKAVKNNIKSQIITVTSLCMIVLLMGVVFASQSYSAAVDAVSINKGNIVESTWNIGIKEDSYKETEGSISPNNRIFSNVIISEVTLNNPGEFMEYSFAIENTGTIESLLNKIDVDGINDNINVTIKLNNEEYDSTKEVVLAKDSKNYITIRAEYKETEYVEPQELKLVTTLDFKQK